MQGTPESQNNLEKEETRWGTHIFQFHFLLQNYSNQDIVVVAKAHMEKWNRLQNP